MGYECCPLYQRVELRGLLRPLLKSGLVGRLTGLAEPWIEKETYAKLQGFLEVARC